jgi:hypothetical protein
MWVIVLWGKTYKKNYNFRRMDLFDLETSLEEAVFFSAVIAPIIFYHKDHLCLLGGGWSLTLLFW